MFFTTPILGGIMRGLLLLLGLCCTVNALADQTIQPGQTTYASGEWVTCQSGFQPPQPPQPPWPPQPPPPPQPTRIQVQVEPNYSCLSAIGPTDGRSLANAAYRCDSRNPSRRSDLRNCRTIQVFVDHGCVDMVMAKRTSLLHADQEETVREACSSQTLLCEL